MKIITKDNFCRDLYTEQVVAENVNIYYGELLVKLYNDKYWDGNSESYLGLVEDDYIPYDGYKEMYGDI